jgi:hypothetical protein
VISKLESITSHLRNESSIVLVEITLQMQRSKRRKNFGADEECQLCVSFLHVSQTPLLEMVKSYTCFGNEFKIITTITDQYKVMTYQQDNWKQSGK